MPSTLEVQGKFQGPVRGLGHLRLLTLVVRAQEAEVAVLGEKGNYKPNGYF